MNMQRLTPFSTTCKLAFVKSTKQFNKSKTS